MTTVAREVEFDETNPAHVEIAEQMAARVQKEHFYAIAEMLRSYHGRRVFWDALDAAGVFNSVFVPEPLKMAFYAGQQDLGHKLQHELVLTDTSLYDQMVREARTRARERTAATQQLLAQLHEE